MVEQKNAKWSGLLQSKRAEFSYKIFKQDNEILVAVADTNILGKKFEDGEIVLSVPTSFYSEKDGSDKDIVREMKKATIINAVGKNVVNLMLKNQLIDKKNILTIKGVPHAQLIKL